MALENGMPEEGEWIKAKAECYPTVFFRTIREAAEQTRLSEKRIAWCIRTGGSWRSWTFDVVAAPYGWNGGNRHG